MKIGIIGYGIVGKGAARMFSRKYEVVVRDTAFPEGHFLEDHFNEKSYKFVNASKKDINGCDIGIICVPTPMAKDYSCDTSIVEEIVSWLETSLILIKSTISPGTTSRLKKEYKKRIVFSPEYMGEGGYWSSYTFHENMEDCPFLILGGSKKDTSELLDKIIPLLGPEKTYELVSAEEAELVKYFENVYFATKVTFAQEMYNVCQQFDVSYWNVRRCWGHDPRVDIMHTAVFPTKRGFSGKCLPKDTLALIKASEKEGYKPQFFIDILRNNNRIRKKAGHKLDYEI